MTAGPVLHRSYVRLITWFLIFHLVYLDKHIIFAAQLSSQNGVNCKTDWYMIKRIRMVMRQRDSGYLLSRTIEFDDVYFSSSTVG